IPLISNRLANLGTPSELAYHSDWDRISAEFTGVRGIGYVAWYPIATQPVSLQKGNEVFEEIGQWKVRHAASSLVVRSDTSSELHIFGPARNDGATSSGPMGWNAPVRAVRPLDEACRVRSEKENICIDNPIQLDQGARDYLNIAESAALLVSDWFPV